MGADLHPQYVPAAGRSERLRPMMAADDSPMNRGVVILRARMRNPYRADRRVARM
jgi:hypothetical protein